MRDDEISDRWANPTLAPVHFGFREMGKSARWSIHPAVGFCTLGTAVLRGSAEWFRVSPRSDRAPLLFAAACRVLYRRHEG